MKSLSDVTLIKLSTYLAVLTASVLIAGKLIAWQITNATSIQASLIDSLLDVGASLTNLIILQQALKPADNEHRFGHGKAESLAALCQSFFILGTSIWLLYEVAERFTDPQPLSETMTGLFVMGYATVFTLGLVSFQRYVVRRTHSTAIAADSLHYQTDLLANLGVILSLCITDYMGWLWLDPLVGALIAVYILHTSWRILKEALDVLMDRELSDTVRDKIIAIALQHPQVIGVHDLRTRSSGRMTFSQMHLDLNGQMTLEAAHTFAKEVSDQIKKVFPKMEVLIHQDPILAPPQLSSGGELDHV